MRNYTRIMKRIALLSILLASTAAFAATSLTQNGITWTLNKTAYESLRDPLDQPPLRDWVKFNIN